jgi:membrane protease YdiL (CAAX protease family)
MTFGVLDHLYVALSAILGPLIAVRAYRRMTARLAAGEAGVRSRTYRTAIGGQLVGATLVLVLWAVSGRAWERLVSLGWIPAGWWTVLAWGVVLLACALLIAQMTAVRGNEAGLSSLRKQMDPVEGLLPHTPAELRLFLAVSLAAGVCEEIVSRGYLLAYFDSLVGPAGAVLASTLLFGLDHAYQGAAGVMKTAVWGLLYAGAYVATGSLLAPMLLHFAVDAASGMVAYLALRPAT